MIWSVMAVGFVRWSIFNERQWTPTIKRNSNSNHCMMMKFFFSFENSSYVIEQEEFRLNCFIKMISNVLSNKDRSRFALKIAVLFLVINLIVKQLKTLFVRFDFVSLFLKKKFTRKYRKENWTIEVHRM